MSLKSISFLFLSLIFASIQLQAQSVCHRVFHSRPSDRLSDVEKYLLNEMQEGIHTGGRTLVLRDVSQRTWPDFKGPYDLIMIENFYEAPKATWVFQLLSQLKQNLVSHPGATIVVLGLSESNRLHIEQAQQNLSQYFFRNFKHVWVSMNQQESRPNEIDTISKSDLLTGVDRSFTMQALYKLVLIHP